ncbi:unnamed protein product [Allacma fusca]|uniref:Uncharacterized protein n=1 Tax=Allacma fusca TaxID=39272 RepID=A0A8J2L569_9HEXA|nr:unnamed protein product [Allacma fusca]
MQHVHPKTGGILGGRRRAEFICNLQLAIIYGPLRNIRQDSMPRWILLSNLAKVEGVSVGKINFVLFPTPNLPWKGTIVRENRKHALKSFVPPSPGWNSRALSVLNYIRAEDKCVGAMERKLFHGVECLYVLPGTSPHIGFISEFETVTSKTLLGIRERERERDILKEITNENQQ